MLLWISLNGLVLPGFFAVANDGACTGHHFSLVCIVVQHAV